MNGRVIRRVRKNIGNHFRKKPAFAHTNILLTYYCTQRCLQCSIPGRAAPDKVMSFENYRTIIDKLDDYGTQGVTLSGGEIMLNPELEEILAYTKTKRFFHVQLLSSLYGPEKLADNFIESAVKSGFSLSISFDGIGELADELRGAKDVSATIIRNIQFLKEMNSKAEKPIAVRMNVVINRKNLSQIPEIIKIAEEHNLKISTDMYRWVSFNHNEVDDLKLINDEEFRSVVELLRKSPTIINPDWILSRYVDYLEGRAPKLCPYLKSPAFGSKFFIHPNGDFYSCMETVIGNLLSDELEEVFESEKWKGLKRAFEECPGCWNNCYTLFCIPLRHALVQFLKMKL